MARKIIILDRTGLPSDQNYRVAFWLDVPVSRQTFYANAAAIMAALAPYAPSAGCVVRLQPAIDLVLLICCCA